MDMISKELLPLKHPLLLSAIFLLFFSPVAISKVLLGSNLSTDGNGVWESPNTNFEFGLFSHSDHPNQYIAGVRFNKKTIPTSEQVVVWSAGAGATVSCGSYLTLAKSGELVLFDSRRGAVVWTSRTSNLSVASAAVEDSGNLILLDGRMGIVWQSFDNPSDVLLPGQTLHSHVSLRAASINSVSSYYTLSVNTLGQLTLNWEIYVTYWTGGGSSLSHPNLSAVISSDGAFQLVDERRNPVWSVHADDHNEQVFRFLRLDVDGNLRLYSWASSVWAWKSVWQAVSDQCDVFATCGLSGLCQFGDSESPVCRCPFTIDSSGTCLVPNQKMCMQGLPLTKYDNTFLYTIYPPNDTFVFSNLSKCRNMCISDPECTAVTYVNDGTGKCLLMRTRYVTGYVRPSIRALSYVKLCADPIAVLPNISGTAPPHSFSEHRSFRECVPCQIGAASGAFVLFLLVQFTILMLIYRKRKPPPPNVLSLFTVNYRSKGLVALSSEEVREATRNFKKEVGAEMFEGNLSNNRPIIIIKLDESIEERKFKNGVLRLGSIHHRSLLRVEGYCCVPGSRILVSEFAKNGSLGCFLREPKLIKKLTWRKRFEICLSVARGISYLHHGCREFFSHEKLSYDNVFLDENLEAKLIRFGFNLFEDNESSEGNNAEKDIEDFGKMVIMLLSAQLGDREIFDWVYKEWQVGRGLNVVDRRIEAGVDSEELERTLRVALWCLQVDRQMRPSMAEVVKILEGVLTVDPPPPLDPVFRQTSEDELSPGIDLE